MANIYVTTSGNDSTGTGTSAKPYRTIEKAIAVSTDGDEIVIGDGEYQSVGGTTGLNPKSNTTLRAANYPELLGPVGDPRGMWTGPHKVIINQVNWSKHAIQLAKKSNVTIIGLEIKNANYGIDIGGSDGKNYRNTVKKLPDTRLRWQRHIHY